MTPACVCGACRGLTAATPVRIANRPGLGAIAYRVGIHARFLRSMSAALSGYPQPALAGLTTRDADDFSIALLDAWAVAADVLTFYQERIANECVLRTATERRSVLELARLIGYALRPGVAAGTWLAFTMDDAPGAPDTATLEAGTRVQSVPGPNETPQTFETVEPLAARAAWNALRPALTAPAVPGAGDTELYLAGTATNLKPGDALLLVGAEREQDATSDRWDVRRLTSVTPDHVANRTRVTWTAPLGSVSPPNQPASRPRAHALRLRTALFGHNAPDPRTLPDTVLSRYGLSTTNPADWSFTFSGGRVHLDGVHPGVREGSWLVLARPGYRELYRVGESVESSRRDYTLTGKTTRVTLEGENLGLFAGAALRDTVVFAESEALAIAERPLDGPLPAETLTLDRRVEGLEPGRPLIVTGRRMRVAVAGQVTLVAAAGGTQALEAGEVLVLRAPVASTAGGKTRVYSLERAGGARGTVTLAAGVAEARLRWTPAADDDPPCSELVLLDRVDEADPERPTLHLSAPLSNAYDRATVTIHGNVAPATHGETVVEVLGHGDAVRPDQRVTLRQPPLTWVSAPTPSGAASTLAVRVNDLLWREVPSFHGRGPRDRVYVTRTDDDGRTVVLFGDGASGARPPSGVQNLRARYRRGIGAAGNLRAGQLSLLMSRPAGLKAVTNPLPATGGADPERLDDARRNAPRTVLTLDRVVSLRDYEHFARAFAGIDKALATWTWDGREHGVLVTVAGTAGAAVEATSDLHRNLAAGLRAAGDPHVPLRVRSYRGATFRLGVRVTVHPDHECERVLARVEAAVRAAFAFAARDFGQPVVLSEVVAVVQAVAGVVAVDVDLLHRSDAAAGRSTRLVATAAGAAAGAELLTIDPGPLARLEGTAGVMADVERLYRLLPAIHRLRDAERGEPLRALLAVVAEQVEVLEENLAQRWDDHFIETCADWVVPYIGDLVGTSPLFDAGRIRQPDTAAARHGDLSGPSLLPEVAQRGRADVARTIHYRRRKATRPMLEALARDVTGWGVHVVEFFAQLVWAQWVRNHLRPDARHTPDLRRLEPLDRLHGPFDDACHTVDVRALAGEEGWYGIRKIGFFVWRLRSYEVMGSLARPVAGAGDFRYHVSPLGQPMPLFARWATGPATEARLPAPIRPTAFYEDLRDYLARPTPRPGVTAFYGLVAGQESAVMPPAPDRSLLVVRDGVPVPPDAVRCMNLATWAQPAEPVLGIDVRRGRLAFGAGFEPASAVEVYHHYGFSADLGGGGYPRAPWLLRRALASLEIVVDQRGVTSGSVTSLGAALAAWEAAGKPDTLVSVVDDRTYEETLTIEPADGRWLVIEAADRRRPHLRLGAPLTITGDHPDAAVTLSGLLIEGRVHVTGSLGRLRVLHATLVPGGGLDGDGDPLANVPSLEVAAGDPGAPRNQRLEVDLAFSISGPLRIPAHARGVWLLDTIVDGLGGTALSGPGGGDDPGPPAWIERSTVLGAAAVRDLTLASEAIFTAPIRAVRRQAGCVRWSYLPPGSVAPRRHRCQPDGEIAARLAAARAAGPVSQAERDAIAARVAAWLVPAFTSTRYGQPAYAQLHPTCPRQIATGAEDGSEMGAFCHLKQPQREANLRQRLAEYLPFGLEPGIIRVT